MRTDRATPTPDPARWDGRLSDGEVALTRLVLADAEDHFAGEDEQLQRWLSGGPSSLEGVRDYLRRVALDWQGAGDPTYHFAIRDQRSDALLGTLDVQFEQPATRPGQANLAYGLYPRWRGRGFATRAVLLGLQFLRDHTDATGALIRTEAENLASAAVAVRAGFTLLTRAEELDGLDRWERPVPQ